MKTALGGQKNADDPHSMGAVEPSTQNDPAGQLLHAG